MTEPLPSGRCHRTATLTPDAQVEIRAFEFHLIVHQGQTVEGCRFCAERARKFPATIQRKQA